MTGALGSWSSALDRRLAAFERDDVVRRLWERDPTLWDGTAETPELTDRLGWLDLPQSMRPHLPHVRRLVEEVRGSVSRVVLLGMGGSSLAPEVLWRTCGRRAGFPIFKMLDSTDPRAVREVVQDGDLGTTLFLVASKSGTTLETSCLLDFFWYATGGRGDQFVTITDPGTVLEERARAQGFRHAFLNPPDIGGRFSALSLFGLVPAAFMGIDIEQLLDRAGSMARRCAVDRPTRDNPGAWLGAALGEAALAGRDKLMVASSDQAGSFGLWVEQLVAESTGKDGKGILPVLGADTSGQAASGSDRVGVRIRSGASPAPPDPADDGMVAEIGLEDPYDLGGEFFRWEFATALAGSVLGLNPFDQPNVAESKHLTQQVLDTGRLEAPPALRRDRVGSFLQGVREGDYVAILAYLPPSEENDGRLERLRRAVAERVPGVVTLGYGPRYLHSTGQLHKGGPRRGHFILVLETTEDDVPIRGRPFGFGRLVAAQGLGDALALRERGRPVLHVRQPEDFLELC